MITSIWGAKPGGAPAYNVAKAAEMALAKAMAHDLARDHIRVNAVAPGSILLPRRRLGAAAEGRSRRHRRVRRARAAVRPLRRARGGRRRRGLPLLAARAVGARRHRRRRRWAEPRVLTSRQSCAILRSCAWDCSWCCARSRVATFASIRSVTTAAVVAAASATARSIIGGDLAGLDLGGVAGDLAHQGPFLDAARRAERRRRSISPPTATPTGRTGAISSASDFDHKKTGGGQISNFQQIGDQRARRNTATGWSSIAGPTAAPAAGSTSEHRPPTAPPPASTCSPAASRSPRPPTRRCAASRSTSGSSTPQGQIDASLTDNSAPAVSDHSLHVDGRQPDQRHLRADLRRVVAGTALTVTWTVVEQLASATSRCSRRRCRRRSSRLRSRPGDPPTGARRRSPARSRSARAASRRRR